MFTVTTNEQLLTDVLSSAESFAQDAAARESSSLDIPLNDLYTSLTNGRYALYRPKSGRVWKFPRQGSFHPPITVLQNTIEALGFEVYRDGRATRVRRSS